VAIPRIKLLSLGSGTLAAFLAFSNVASALQPLESFVAGARKQSFSAREQAVSVRQRSAEEEVAFGRLLPSLSARGTYSYNQYEARVTVPGSTTSIVITPHNQLDAVFQLNVPILDFASRARWSQAELLTAVTELQGELVGLELDRVVTRLYASFIGASALANAAEQSIDLAQKNFEFVQTRVSLGAATELDKARAQANLERAKQDRAEAELGRTLYARQLATLTGIEPEPVAQFPEDGLQPEAPLGQWLGVQNTPTDRLAIKLTEAAEAGKRAASYALLPTLSGVAQERLTNATGFAGQVSSYTLQAVVSWNLDYATYSAPEVQNAAIELQRVRTERTRRELEDQIFDSYQRVQSGIVKSSSARAQVAAANQAATLAGERYRAGAATQLDVTQSQRDAFLANAARIQADADLAYARAMLRINAGQSPTNPASATP
jgi:outer membrane protein